MAQNYVLLETIALNQTTASVTFDNLPTSGYTDLKVVGSFRGTTAQVYEITHLRFNGLTTNLSSRSVEGNGAAASSFSNSHIYFSSGVGASATSNTYSNAEAYILDYRSSNHKSVSIENTGENNATTSYSQITAGLWSNTAAITSIELAPTGSFVTGSTFSLYGLAATGTTPVTAPFATGGNIVANDGTYWYHAFTSSGIFTPGKALTCHYLVIAGGGGGGNGGGGGAGGLRSTLTQTGGNTAGNNLESPLSVAAQAYPITIGAGGLGTFNGSNSVFSSITSIGGGSGGPITSSDGIAGGSGGGAAYSVGAGVKTGGAGTANQGYAGGTTLLATARFSGSGGGGAGAVGNNQATTDIGGAGGAGVVLTAFATPTGTGVSGYYAGGGGGGVGQSGGTPGVGGSGGGGNGTQGGTGAVGVINTGSGGGADQAQGGSGIVIIRYPMV